MALTLAQGAQLVTDPAFTSRVRGAMVRAAIAVASEAQSSLTTNAWFKRRHLSVRILNSPDGVLPSFVAAVAADANSGLSWFSPVAISSSTNANTSVVTTAADHGLSSGDVVAVKEHAGNTAANGTWAATVLTATTFSIPQPANGAGTATGTVQKYMSDNDIAFTVNSAFSAVAGLLPGE